MMKRSLLALFLILVFATGAGAEVTAWLNPGVAANVARSGSGDVWTDPDNARNGSTSDYAEATPNAGAYSDWLRLTDFGLAAAIPTGATIDGIEVRKFRRASSSSREFHDNAIYLRRSTGQAGENKALSGNWGTTAVTDYHGGFTDLWGAAWTRDDIIHPDFGVDISIGENGTGYRAEIYYVQVRVHYTPAPAGTFKVAGVKNPAKIAGVLSPSLVAGVATGAAPTPPPPPPSGEDPEIYFEEATSSCNEEDGTKNLTVRLSRPSSSPITCEWSAAGTRSWDGAQSSSYGSGADFSPASGQITFEPGETSKVIALTIIDGTAAEPDQKLEVVLSNPTNATLRAGSESHHLTIVDNDRSCEVLDMTNLPSTFPISGTSGWDTAWQGSAWNVSTSDDGVNNRNRMQAFFNYLNTYHIGKSFVLYFPVGTYTFNCSQGPGKTSMHPPLRNCQITIIGGGADAREHPEVPQTVFQYALPYHEMVTRMFDNYVNYDMGNYHWNSPEDSEPNRFLVKNIVFNGRTNETGLNYWDMSLYSGNFEKSPFLFISGHKSEQPALPWGYLQWTVENCKTMWNGTGGINAYRYSRLQMHNVHSDNNYKGFIVSSGGPSEVYAYNIKSYGSLWGGGLWFEGEKFLDTEVPVSIYGSNWEILNGFRWYIATRGGGSVEVSNVYFGPNTTDYTGYTTAGIQIHPSLTYALWGSNSNYPNSHITISDSTFYVPSDHDLRAGGVMTWNNVNFVGYVHINDDISGSLADQGPHAGPAYRITAAPLYGEVADYRANFNNCTFSFLGNRPSGYSLTGINYSTSDYFDTSTCPDAYVKYTNCTFDSSLDTAFRVRPGGGSYGIITHIFDTCTFNNTNYNGVYTFETTKWGDALGSQGILKVKNPTYAAGMSKIYYLQGASGDKQDFSWLYHSGALTAAQTVNSLGTQYGLDKLSIANAETSARLNSIPRSSQTTVTTAEPHGLATGDKIVFDGFDSTANPSWFKNLSPHADVPLFTAEVLNSTQFKVKDAAGTSYLDSSGYSASYDNNKDIARVSKYPFRTITGSAGDNPVTSKPAGLVGDRYDAGGTYYRCVTSGVQGSSAWVAE